MSQQINLINPIFLQRRKQFSAVTLAQGLGVILLALAAFAAYSAYQAAQIAREARTAAAALKAAQDRLVAVAEKNRPRPADKALEEAIAAAAARLAASQQILGFVQKGQPDGDASHAAVMRALARRAMPGVWLTGLNLDNGERALEIAGRALAPELLPAYIRSLGQESALAGKPLGSMTLQADAAPQADATPGSVSFTLGSADATAHAGQPAAGASGSQR